MESKKYVRSYYIIPVFLLILLTGSLFIIGTGDIDGDGGGGGGYSTYYITSDGDYYGDPSGATESKTQPIGYTTDNTDCDDTDNSIHPGAREIDDDGIDQDCDGFDPSGKGTVTEIITGLMWQREDDDNAYTWTSAVTYCENLSLGGHSDWRLPHIKELESIVVNTVEYNPDINSTTFPNTNLSDYWSSTTLAGPYSSPFVWTVIFNRGFVNITNKSTYNNVRCVRGVTIADDFTDNGNGTVTDNNTGFMWQQEDNDTKCTWEEALTYCEDTLTLAGYSDWRLPSRMELASIVDYDTRDPSIDSTMFPNTNLFSYWSSTPKVSNYPTSQVWVVSFRPETMFMYNSESTTYTYRKSHYYYVRCVRGGQ